MRISSVSHAACCLIVFGFQPHSGDLAVHGPATGVGQGELSQRDDVQNGGPCMLGPNGGEPDSGWISMSCHSASFELRRQHNSLGDNALRAIGRSARIAGPIHQGNNVRGGRANARAAISVGSMRG